MGPNKNKARASVYRTILSGRGRYCLRAHIVCDFHFASGAYSVHPDHVGYATLRPTNMAEFDALWGAICSTNGANGRGCPVPAFSDSLTVNRRT